MLTTFSQLIKASHVLVSWIPCVHFHCGFPCLYNDMTFVLDSVTFRGYGFETVVGVALALMHASIAYEYKYAWATSTTTSKLCPWNVLNIQHMTKIFQVLSLHWSFMHKIIYYIARWEGGPSSRLWFYHFPFNMMLISS